jgi:hypothetical protein
MFERFWGSGRPSRALRVFAPIAVVASAALFACTGPALASSIHLSAGSFGASSSTPSNPDPLGSPGAVAVDNSSGASAHDLYVTDPAHFRIEKFDAEGHLLLMFGKQVNKTKTTEGAGEAQENVCVLTSGDECQSGVQGTAGKGQFSAPAFIAVDSSTGPSSGDVYLADTATNVVYKFSSAGAFISENNGEGSGEGHFTGLDGVAVDASGGVEILDRLNGPQIFRFDQAGSFVSPPFLPGGAKPAGLAIDGAGASYLVEGLEAVEKIDASGKKVGRVLLPPFQEGPPTTGLTADQLTNDLYVDTGLEVEHVAPSCDPSKGLCQIADTFGVPALTEGRGLGVDQANNTVYAADSSAPGTVQRFAVGLEATTGGSSGVGTAGATLEGTVNPEGSTVTECLFEYGTSEEYGQSAPCGGTVGGGTTPVAVNAKLTGLKGGTTYHYRIFARNGNGAVAGEDANLKTLTTPTIDSAEAIEVTATSAKLTAKINPHGIDAKYRFEYGTTTAYGMSIPIPDQDIGSGTTPVTVSQTVEGLQANTEYHFRVLVNNTITGEDHTFAFLSEEGSKGCSNEALRSGLSARLPDCRGYEMVTPPNKNAALIGALFPSNVAPQISSDGSRLTVPSIQCFENSPSCVATRLGRGGQVYEFTSGGEGWQTNPLAPPVSALPTSSWWSFGAQAGTYLLSAPTGPQGQDEYYMRRADGSLEEIGPFAEAEEAAANPHRLTAPTLVSNASPAAVVFETLHPVWSFDHTESNANSLYEYIGAGHSQPDLVGVSGGAGSTDLISACGTSISMESQARGAAYGTLSADGRIALFTAARCPAGGTGTNVGVEVPAAELYERIDGARTVQLSKATPSNCTTSDCQNSAPGDAVLEGASNDTSRVLFTSTQQLSDEASEDRHGGDESLHCARTSPSASGCNLYLSECPAHCEDEAQRKLIDVSAGAQNSGGPKVQGTVALSPDGTHVYFVAKGTLTSVANAQGQKAQLGANNLYLYERGEAHANGQLSFVATLSPRDSVNWKTIGLQGLGTANTTPDGRYLVFASHRGLTRNAKAGDGPTQIYRFDAQGGQMARISHGRAGFGDDGNAGREDANASIVNAYDAFELGAGPARSNPTMSDDGRYVFFQSPVGLTPRALDEVKTGGIEPGGGEELARNIYEWEAVGNEGCNEPQGCVSLISDGKDKTESGKVEAFTPELLGTDATGEDVFFATADELTAKDTDTQRDYYDARIGGGEEPTVTPPSCEESDTCHRPPPPPPVFGPLTSIAVGPSANFPAQPLTIGPPSGGSGSGSGKPTKAQQLAKALKSCKAKHSGAKAKKQREACEKTARKKFGPKPKPKRKPTSHKRAKAKRKGQR